MKYNAKDRKLIAQAAECAKRPDPLSPKNPKPKVYDPWAKAGTLHLDGNLYRAQINDDDDCPVSVSRIYKTGERRTIVIFGSKITQIKQADGSWWNIEVTR